MGIWNALVIIGALGYFVDVFDLFLFNVFRIPSLTALGVLPNQMLPIGMRILNLQMAGMVLGGLVLGIFADRRGRKSALFASILLYSVSTFLNAFVHSVTAYGVLRFLAGFGLAGELGAAVTLVTEALPKEKRGLGTTLVAAIGLTGGMVAALSAEFVSWRAAYVLGGCLGLLLLFLRFSISESPLFAKMDLSLRFDLRFLFGNWKNLKRYVSCILVGVPVYFVSGILIAFAPEFAKALSVQGEVVVSRAVLFSYIGTVFGDLVCGVLSQVFKTRKKVISAYLFLNLFAIGLYLCFSGVSNFRFYFACGLIGVTAGFWVVLLSLCAEQFGTNLRATVATSVPCFVRGSVIAMSSAFLLLRPHFGVVHSAGILAMLVTTLALFGISLLNETFFREMDFLETISR